MKSDSKDHLYTKEMHYIHTTKNKITKLMFRHAEFACVILHNVMKR